MGWSAIIYMAAISSVDEQLYEAARIDGAGEFRILGTVVIPMSVPMIATMTLLIGLSYWNDWKNGLYYLQQTRNLYSIQVLLNDMLRDVQGRGLGRRNRRDDAEHRHPHGHCGRRRAPGPDRLPLLPEVFRQGHHDRRGQGLSADAAAHVLRSFR